MFFFKRKPEAARYLFNSGKLDDAIMEIARYGALDPKERSQTNLPGFLKKDLPFFANEMVKDYPRCAFCEETRDDLTGYHFRPPYDAEPRDSRDERESYFWLSLSEENIFPICPDCRPENRHYFPLHSGARARPDEWLFAAAIEVLEHKKTPSRDVTPLGAIDFYDAIRNTSAAEQVTRFFFDTKISKVRGTSRLGGDFQQLWFNFKDRHSKADDFSKMFSTRKSENSVLFEPGFIRDPARYFRATPEGFLMSIELPHLSSATNEPRRAVVTNDHFNLNRQDLIERRNAVLDKRLEQLRFMANEVIDIPEAFDFGSMDFGSAWYLLLNDIGRAWAQRLGLTGSFSRSNIFATFQRLLELHQPGPLEDAIEAAGRMTRSIPTSPLKVGQTRTRPIIDASKQANVTSILIENFKAIEDLSVDLPRRVANDKAAPSPAIMMLGENACGKSTILEAITVATVGPDAFEALDLDTNKLVLNPRYMGLKEPNSLIDERECLIVVKLETGKTYRTRFKRGSHVTREVEEAEGGWRNITPEDGLNLFAFGAHRLFGAKTRNDGPTANIRTLFDQAALLGDPEAWMIALHARDPDALNEVVAQLRDLISIDGTFKSIEVVPDPDNPEKHICEIVISSSAWDSRAPNYDVRMPLSTVSSGYRTIIALFCDLMSGLLQDVPEDQVNEAAIKEALNTPVTVMIDEIEAHLHPRWKMQVVEKLRVVLKNAYFILTSHDPLCVRGMGNDEVLVLHRGQNTGGVSKSGLLERVTYQVSSIKTELFTVEQLLTSDLFNLLSTENQKREALLAEKIENGVGRDQFEQEVADALPIGDSVVTRLVQEAIWEYLKEARGKRPQDKAGARAKAIQNIKNQLRKASF